MTRAPRSRGARGKTEVLPLCRCAPGEGLRAEGLVARLGDSDGLRGVTFEVRPGEHVAVVGPNGSGKTTLLLALKGAVSPSAGRVTVAGQTVGRFDPRVGLVLANPEDQGVAPVVEDDVAFGLENQGFCPGEIRARVVQSLRSVGLEDLRDAPVHALSGGQQQKVALASVLALGARFLLLDEATSMLGPRDRDDLMALLASLCRTGLGVVQVTHAAEETLWARRLVSLARGEIAFQGTPGEFFAWSGCPWPAPAYLRMRAALDAEDLASPNYGRLVRWLGSR